MSDGGHVWWEDAVVYEVYPHSFADADGDGVGDLRWLDAGGLVCFAREPGFILAANLGAVPAQLPAHREILLASGPVTHGRLPPDTAGWLSS